MRKAGLLLIFLSVAVFAGQNPGPPDPTKDIVYFCPMDKDIRSHDPGNCSRCGMKMVAGIPEPAEFHMDVTMTPRPPKPNEKTRLTFDIRDPWKNNPVRKFSLVHEKLFHAFIVSRDLQFFVHDHPVWENGAFHYEIAFPKSGMYRVLGDFYPEAATPQLLSKTIYVVGLDQPATPLEADYSPKTAENLRIELTTIPAQPVAGLETQLRFRLDPPSGLEKYLGVWGHMLVASDDLIDAMHAHPHFADGGPEIEFHVNFPRDRAYRVWVQFQRAGIVNTAHFDIPVKKFGSDPFGREEP